MIESLKKIIKTNVIVQILGILIIPVLSISYSIKDIGVYGLIFASSSFLGNFICLRIENSFFSNSVIAVEKVVNTFISILLLVIFPLLFVIYAFNNINNLILIIFGAVGISFYNFYYNFLVRKSEERRYNNIKLSRVIMELIVVLLCCYSAKSIHFTIFCIFSTYYVFLLWSWRFSFNFKEFIEYFMVNKNLIFSDLVSTILFSSYMQGPYFLLGRINLEFVGFYVLIQKFLLVPTLMVSQSIGVVLKQYAAIEYEEDKKIKNTIGSLIKILKKWIFILPIILSSSALIFFIIDNIKYSGIFIVFLILLPLIIVRFFHQCYCQIVYVLRMQKSYMIMNLSLSISLLVAYFCSIGSALIFMGLYAFFGLVIYLLFFYYFMMNVSKRGLL